MSKPQVTLTSLLSLWCFIATLRAFLILDLHFQDTARFILVLNFVSYSASETGLFLWFCSLFFWIRNAWDLIRGKSIVFSDVLFPLLMVFVHLDGLSCYCFGRCRTLKTTLIFCTLCDNNYTKIYSFLMVTVVVLVSGDKLKIVDVGGTFQQVTQP